MPNFVEEGECMSDEGCIFTSGEYLCLITACDNRITSNGRRDHVTVLTLEDEIVLKRCKMVVTSICDEVACVAKEIVTL